MLLVAPTRIAAAAETEEEDGEVGEEEEEEGEEETAAGGEDRHHLMGSLLGLEARQVRYRRAWKQALPVAGTARKGLVSSSPTVIPTPARRRFCGVWWRSRRVDIRGRAWNRHHHSANLAVQS